MLGFAECFGVFATACALACSQPRIMAAARMYDSADYLTQWVPQLVLLATLSAITVFRREMSCNHCYHDHPSDNEDAEGKEEQQHKEHNEEFYHWNEQDAEALLDGVGLTYSGAPFWWWGDLAATFNKATWLSSLGTTGTNSDNKDMNMLTEDWLDHAGHFLSPWGLTASATCVSSQHIWASPSLSKRSQHVLGGEVALPPDLLVHVASFLTAHDATRLALVHRASHDFVYNHRSQHTTKQQSNALWSTLWHRDYGWTLTPEAPWLTTPTQTPHPRAISADFYFTYATCWLDFCLAGHNTHQSTLIGLHGHVYNVTNFVTAHPGSPETLQSQAGRDATTFFANIRHSHSALRQAQDWCVAVASPSGGVTPVKQGTLSQDSTAGVPMPPTGHGRPATFGLTRIQQWYRREQTAAMVRARRRYASAPRLTDVHVYYDPLVQKWKAWYTNRQMEPVFCGSI